MTTFNSPENIRCFSVQGVSMYTLYPLQPFSSIIQILNLNLCACMALEAAVQNVVANLQKPVQQWQCQLQRLLQSSVCCSLITNLACGSLVNYYSFIQLFLLLDYITSYISHASYSGSYSPLFVVLQLLIQPVGVW